MFMSESMKIAVSLNNFSMHNHCLIVSLQNNCVNLSEIHQLRVVI
jgi:hypothetical protein